LATQEKGETLIEAEAAGTLRLIKIAILRALQ
jgi:hypothetical protein